METEQISLYGFMYASLVIVVCCLSLHLKNHFGCIGGKRRNSTQSMTGDNTLNHEQNGFEKRQKTLLCCLYPLNGHIEFYPVSTLLYFLFLLFTIISMIMFDSQFYPQPLSRNASIKGYCPIIFNISNFIDNPLQFTSLYIHNNDIIEYLWSYIVLLLVLWETLFNFYRFYDAKFIFRYFRNASKVRIFSLFSIYAFAFSLLYAIQIHLYWFIFPIIILVHFIFNMYCINGFVSILKYQYLHLWEGEMEAIKNHKIMKELLHIIHRVQICSIITTLISCMFLFSINGCYTSYTIILLPGLWMISSIVWTLNFAKNESWFQRKYKKASISFKRIFTKRLNPGSDMSSCDDHHNINGNSGILKLKSPSPTSPKVDNKRCGPNTKGSNNNNNNHETSTKLHNVHSSSGDIQAMILENQMQFHKRFESNKSKLETLETSIPTTGTNMNIGVTATISEAEKDFRDYQPKSILPVFSYTQSITNNNPMGNDNKNPKQDHINITVENQNENQHENTSVSYQYPKEYENEMNETDQEMSKTKTLTKNRKALELLGVVEKENINNNENMISMEIQESNDDDDDPEMETVIEFPDTAPQIHPQTSDTISYDEYNKTMENDINDDNLSSNAPTSPLTPFSYDRKHFDLAEMKIVLANPTDPIISDTCSNSNNGRHPHKHSNNNYRVQSKTPGPKRKDLNFGLDMPGQIKPHKRSLSTMSGIPSKQGEAMAASSILHMMVNQGFYSKTGLNSVNQIRNLGM